MTITAIKPETAIAAHHGLSMFNIENVATPAVVAPSKVTNPNVERLLNLMCVIQAILFMGIAFPALWAANTGAVEPLIAAAGLSFTLAAYTISKSMCDYIEQKKRGGSNV